ncbi:MAG: serine/threonine-protein kinase, partial [Pyrinomonadaceae bacterium]
MSDLDFTGQTLDGKYQMTRELGRGGMGTVYLATHLGTERPVAVKIIAPQFMQRAEFVERFRREARAAGRLRHPNVVNVTDFGFAETADGQVAYLVMEYLDGCTLGEILDEEKNLPVAWTLDILEQVCSAVHEAHLQGIIHRDLKPDNIWLEPNQRGGYTVKVLDFGIAKLEEHDVPSAIDGTGHDFVPLSNTHVASAKTTFAGTDAGGTFAGVAATHVGDGDTISRASENKTLVSEAGTMLLEPLVSEAKTAIYDDGDISQQETIGTRLSLEPGATAHERSSSSRSAKHTLTRSLYDSRGSAELTRVGAVLGTPLY